MAGKLNVALMELSLDEYIARNNIFNSSEPSNSASSGGRFVAGRRHNTEVEADEDADDDTIIISDGELGEDSNFDLDAMETQPPKPKQTQIPMKNRQSNSNTGSSVDLLTKDNVGNATTVNIQQWCIRGKNQHQRNIRQQCSGLDAFDISTQQQPKPQQWKKQRSNNRSRGFFHGMRGHGGAPGRRNLHFSNMTYNIRNNNASRGVYKSRPSNVAFGSNYDAIADSRNIRVQVLRNRAQPDNAMRICRAPPDAANFPQQQNNLGNVMTMAMDGVFQMGVIPMLCAKFLEFLGNMQTDKYNMSLQQDIHDLQGKPFFCKSPGDKVISSTGNGIENLYVVPHATNVKLNYRFS